MKSRISMIIFVASIAIAVSGCSSITSARKSLSEKILNNDLNNTHISDKKADEVLVALDKHIAAEVRDAVGKHMEDWNTVAPNVKRILDMGQELEKVVAMSQEIEYIMSTIDNTALAELGISELSNSRQSVGTFNTIEPRPEDSFEELDTIASAVKNQDGLASDELITKSVNELATPLVASAPKLMQVDHTSTEDRDKIEAAKFSTVLTSNTSDVAALRTAPLQSSPFKPLLTKFSNEAVERSNCEGDKNILLAMDAYRGQYAIHLASYKKQENLAPGASNLSVKFEHALCGKVAIFKPVEVSGTNYFSLRMGPYATKGDANAACRSIQAKSGYCGVTPFEGVPL